MKEQYDIDIKKLGDSILGKSQVMLENLVGNQYFQAIMAFVFIRRIDCLIGKYATESYNYYSANKERYSDERLNNGLRNISGGLHFYNYSGYTLADIVNTNLSLNVIVSSYIDGFSNNVKEILNGLNFPYTISALQRKPVNLIRIISAFLNIDLSSSTIDNDEYQELISYLISKRNNSSSRLYATSPELTQLISGCLFNNNCVKDGNKTLTIYDPTCGTGLLLSSVGVRAKNIAVHQDNIALYGQDIDFSLVSIAKAMVMFLGNDNSCVKHGDTILNDLFPDYYFQYIVADLPFGMYFGSVMNEFKNQFKNQLIVDKRFQIGLPNSSEFLFIQHIISKMDPKGSRAAFITPISALWEGDIRSGESRIRRWLFENDMVEAIISLPGGLLPFSNVHICLWILNNQKNNLRRGYVQLINVKDFNPNRINANDVISEILDVYKNMNNNDTSKLVFNNSFGFFEVELHERGGKDKKITIDLDTNITDYINREVTPYAKGEIFIDYSSVEKGYAVQFSKFFPEENQEVNFQTLSKSVLSLIDDVRSLEDDIVGDLIPNEGISNEEQIEYGNTHHDDTIPLFAFADTIKGQSKQPISDVNIPFISVSYLRGNHAKQGLHVMSEKAYTNKKCVTEKDVLVITTGTNSGEVFKGVYGIASSSFTIVRLTDGVVDVDFLYYLLKGYERDIRSLAIGTYIKYINLYTLSNMKFRIPTLNEQKRISHLLNNIVSKIDKITSLLGNNDNLLTQYKQALIENVIKGKIKI